MSLPARLVEFAEALRLHAIAVGPSETIDAGRVIDVLGMSDRHALKAGLAAAFCRKSADRDVFDMTFDLFFPVGSGQPEAAKVSIADQDLDDLRQLLQYLLAEGDRRQLEQLAQVAVDNLGQVGTPGTAKEGFSAYQTLEQLRPQTLIAGAEAAAGAAGGFTDRLTREEIRQSVQAFREMVASEARRRTAELRGRDVVSRHAIAPMGDQLSFLTANPRELEQLRKAVQPLSRKLATRLSARRRRRRRGRIDMRRTLRRAMGTGGVPMRPVYELPRRTRPDLVLLCDVSGSVAGFSEFTMLLVKALADQFNHVRVFAFINAMDEVTDLVKDGGDQLLERIVHERKVTKWHTSSDYGEALSDFASEYLDALGPRTSVLILGDARNNNQKPRLEALHEIAARAKSVFWLNPESPATWGLGDSIAPDYARIVPMHQCSTAEQLTQFAGRLLPV